MLNRVKNKLALKRKPEPSPRSRAITVLPLLFCMCAGLTIISPSHAFAACTSPAGVAGSLNYDDTTKTQTICDGTTWKTVKVTDYTTGTGARISAQIAPDSGTCTAIKTGRIRYDGTNVWEYCNGSAWTPFDQGACVGPTSCPTVGSVCTDGSVFIGCPAPNYYRTYAARCDVGMSGATCTTGTRTGATWVTQVTNCQNLTQHSKTDWYLPNRSEIWQMYAHIMSTANYFGTGTNYWTSEAVGYYGTATDAWFFGTNSIQNIIARSNTLPARCIRDESGCPEIGNVCANGMINAGNYNGTTIYVAAADAPTTLIWGPNTTTGMGFCASAPYLYGSCDDGRGNTKLVVGLGTYPAAAYCASLNAHGYSTGWYLPSANELNVAYLNLKSGKAAGTLNFLDTYYWSSTENSATAAFYQDFTGASGFQGNPTKASTSARVRCMRR